MLLTRVVVFLGVSLVVLGRGEAGEIIQQGGRQVWLPQACEMPLAPSVNRAVNRADAQGLNQSIIGFNRYVAEIDAYNQCLSQEAAKDAEGLVGVINDSVRNLQNEAIAGVEVERAALVSGKP